MNEVEQSTAVDQTGALEITSVESYGQFNGIDYLRYVGRLIGDADGGAPFEIVAPAEPGRGNGRLLIEPYHYTEGAGARNAFLTPDFLFERGFSHASVCWQPPLPDVAEEHPCGGFEGGAEAESQILSDFVVSLRRGDAADMVGKLDYLYSIGFSNSVEPLQRLLLEPSGQGLFDLSILITTGWPLPLEPFAPPPELMPETLIPDENNGRVLLLQSEADLIWSNGALLRDDGNNPNYRSYEVAGAQHIQAWPFPDAGLEFLPVIRGIFMAGDRWVTGGVEPPESVFVEEVPMDAIDPVYGMPTGIARDDDLNAVGGVRLPDLALGRSQYIAVNFDEFPLIGTSIDLACEPLPDGAVRFPDHGTYMTRFVQEAARLVDEGFLLPADAYRMIAAAVSNDVGAPGACP